MTFIDDNGRRFTALRIYYVSRAALSRSTRHHDEDGDPRRAS